MKINTKRKVLGGLAIIGLIVSLGGCAKEPAPYAVEEGIELQCYIYKNYKNLADISAEYKRKLRPARGKAKEKRQTYEDEVDYMWSGAEKYEYTIYCIDNNGQDSEFSIIAYYDPNTREVVDIIEDRGSGWEAAWWQRIYG